MVQVQIVEEELILVAAKGYLSEDCFLDREKKIIDWRETSKLPLITLKKDMHCGPVWTCCTKKCGDEAGYFL